MGKRILVGALLLHDFGHGFVNVTAGGRLLSLKVLDFSVSGVPTLLFVILHAGTVQSNRSDGHRNGQNATNDKGEKQALRVSLVGLMGHAEFLKVFEGQALDHEWIPVRKNGMIFSLDV